MGYELDPKTLELHKRGVYREVVEKHTTIRVLGSIKQCPVKGHVGNCPHVQCRNALVHTGLWEIKLELGDSDSDDENPYRIMQFEDLRRIEQRCSADGSPSGAISDSQE